MKAKLGWLALGILAVCLMALLLKMQERHMALCVEERIFCYD